MTNLLVTLAPAAEASKVNQFVIIGRFRRTRPTAACGPGIQDLLSQGLGCPVFALPTFVLPLLCPTDADHNVHHTVDAPNESFNSPFVILCVNALGTIEL
ncbi:hypothetical protein DENSPDRAFT_879922 [Dentipellis sp. KUC8613]|nr:hypothetical protein DENSPDRAFT_879922 [Dentipellis sp. KUC8613]